MWVMTQHGFFSAVEADDDDTLVVVRTRSRADLDHLHTWLRDLGAPSEIITYAVSDYPWRTITTKAGWGEYLKAQADGIDYGNYKSRVSEVNPRRAHTYAEVWGTLLQIEDEPGADTAHHRNPYAPQPHLDWDYDRPYLTDPFYVET